MRFWFFTFGCRVNQYETQALRERLLCDGGAGADSFEGADVCVVNTCTVTAEADREALRLIRKIARRNPAARLVVTGCLASRDPRMILKEAPAALVVGNEGKAELPALLGCSAAPAGITGFAGHSRAFVKIQDGCNMSCRFCVIPSIRPALSSKPWSELEAEVRGLISRGVPEIVLCGVRLGRYRADDSQGRKVDFVGALERLAELPGEFRLRLSSLEITDVTGRLISLMARSRGKLCPSLHAPLQSGSETVLKRMGRWYSAAFYRRRIEVLRAAVPGVAVFADLMTGFPGETEAEHEESRRFVEALGFSGLHVFRYSKRPGTPAARLPQVPEKEILCRAEEFRVLDRALREAFAARAVGQERTVVPELAGREGLTEDFLTVRLSRPVARGLNRVSVERSDEALVPAAG